MAKLELSDAHADWLEVKRKLPSELAARMGVVSVGQNLAFEYRLNGAVLYLKVRKEIAKDGETSKTYWIDPKGSVLLFWNEDCLSELLSNAPLIITEGELDALSFLAAGASPVVSVPNGSPFDIPGKGEIIPEQDNAFRYLWDGNKLKAGLQGWKNIILATDGDQKGRVLRDELAIRLGRSRCWYVTYPPRCKDANEVLVAHGVEALQKLIADAKPIVPDKLVSFSEIPVRELKRYSSGWGNSFDDHFMVAPPQLIIVTGVPNHGKSEWVLSLVANLARLHGMKGAILQFEDDTERVRGTLLRYAKSWSGPQQRCGIDDPVAWIDRMFKTVSPNEELDDGNDFGIPWLTATIEEAATRHGCGWVYIDPWNEIEHLWGRQDTEAVYLTRALKYLKRLARRFQIAIIIVAHPTVEAGRRMTLASTSLYDISGGATWNNKADLGVVVWADDALRPERAVKI